MSIRIITDSASDISQEDAKKLGIDVIPLKTIFKNKEYLDGVTLSHDEFYNKLIEESEFPKTSQINPFSYEECFEKYDKNDDIIVITISKKMSGCYQSAMIASEDYDNVTVINSRNVSIGEQILVKYAIRLRDEGKTAKELIDLVNEEKYNIDLVSLFDTLEYLKKGGRINATKAFIGTILSIKPVIGVKDGKVAILGKARGSKAGNNLLRNMIKDSGGINFDLPYVVGYTGLSDQKLLKYLEDSKDLYDCEMSSIPVTTIGSTIGTHAGPGAIGVAYFKNKNK